uniref:Tripartite motif-containing protein 66 n=1 Tax=Oryzias latipes TaxID=8090 RepID=A0A3P9M5Y5_ORYLA
MEKICSECTEPTLAHSLCTLCNKWLCYQCTDVHQHHRASTNSQYADSYQQQRAGAAQPQCPDLHLRGSSSLPPPAQGPGSNPCSLLMCHSHRQEPLEFFCESCDLLCCSSCHLSSHKNHRVLQIRKALQDQQWLFENLIVQVEERRSAVESGAKQIEDRLHEVKIAHRKAENQIKMAKMIMMNELNKRANLLIEQLEKISQDFQHSLEDQLQGAIEICGQLDHIQKFVTWATTHHCRGPVLFSRALISFQMQHLLDASLHCDSWSPVKIKFNWDASYWTKQISSLGQLTVEGGSCPHPSGFNSSSVMRPQPVACFALPTMFCRGREPDCGYQTCCEPQLCCLHGIPSKSDMSSLDKSQVETTLYNSSFSQDTLLSGSLHQNQQLQKCWDTENSLQYPTATSPVIQLTCSQGPVVEPQVADSLAHSHSISYTAFQEHQGEVLPDSQTKLNRGRQGPCKGKLSPSTPLLQELRHKVMDKDILAEDSCGERLRVEETCVQTGVEIRELLDAELDRREQNPLQQQPIQASIRTVDLQKTRLLLTLRDHGIGKRSPSLDAPATARMCASGEQGGRPGLSSEGSRRKRRSRSIPTELVAPSTSSYHDQPTGCSNSQNAGPATKDDVTDHRQRRSSDGVLCGIKESSSEMVSSGRLQSHSLSQKLDPGHTAFVIKDSDHGAKDKDRGSSHRDVSKDSIKNRVPVVCLERLKILVSQLPPHGRRQSDPLPASGLEKCETVIVEEAAGSPGRKTNCSFTAEQSNSISTDFNIHNSRERLRSHKASTLLSTGSKYEPQRDSVLDLDSDSEPRSGSEEAVASPLHPNPRLDSEASLESDPNGQSSLEAELDCVAGVKSSAAGEMCGDSELTLEYEADPESDGAAGSEDNQGLDAEEESEDADTESDVLPEYRPTFLAYTDSDAVSDQPADSQGSVESELDVESNAEGANDDPQPLRSDVEEELHIGPVQRPLLIANPTDQGDSEEIQSEHDSAEMESEDFCAVCLIGGELLCCDRCPKVFHLSCHVPPLLSFPSGDWVCSLCRDAIQPEVQYNCENERASGANPLHGLSACDQRKCERLTLLILSNILSAPFHEPVSPLARHYYQIIKRPMDLSVIRARLSKGNPVHYTSADQFVADVYLMFRNCAKFNYPDSEVAQAGRSLEVFFTSKLKEVFPDRAFQVAEADSDSDEYDEACRTAESGFPWPERRECHRKRKRRQSLKSRRHYF